MGDDPLLPEQLIAEARASARGSAAATGGTVINITHEHIAKPSVVMMSICIGLAVGISIIGMVMMNYWMSVFRDEVRATLEQSEKRSLDRVNATEKRVMDYAGIGNRESRVAQDQVKDLEIKVGILEKR